MAIPGFDANSYLAANIDLLRAGLNAADAESHYTAFGQREKRSTTFNGSAYLASHPDLRRAFGSDASAATQHYISSGWKEGRSITFDSATYLASNIDLLRAGLTTDNAAQHYLNYGLNENRSTASFDYSLYLQANTDLSAGRIYTSKAATEHYVTFGWREGRRLVPAVHATGSGTVGPSAGGGGGYILYKGETYEAKVTRQPQSPDLGADYFLEVGTIDRSNTVEIFPGFYSGTSTFTPIASDDNSGGGLNPRLLFTPTQTGIYTFMVSVKNNVSTTYQLTIDSV